MKLVKICIVFTSLFCSFQTLAQSNSVITQDLNTAIENVEKYAAKIKADNKIQGVSLAVLLNGQLLHQTSMGYTDANLKNKIDINTVFPIASITKLFVASSVLQLLPQHNLSPNTEIGEVLDDIPNHWKQVKIKHLLSHTSGLPDYYSKKTDPSSLNEALNLVRTDDFEFNTGDDVSYNQTGFALLHLLVEALSGKTLEQYIQQHHIDRFGLKDTYYQRAPTEVSNTTDMFIKKRSQVKPFDLVYTRALHGSAGLNTSNNDLTKWITALVNGNVLSNEQLEQAWQPVLLQNGEPSIFGLGWWVTQTDKVDISGHSGADTSEVRHYIHKATGESITVIWLSNTLGFNPQQSVNTIAGYFMKDITNCSRFLFWQLDCEPPK